MAASSQRRRLGHGTPARRSSALARARGCSRSGRRRSPGKAARAGSPSRPRSRPGPGGAVRRRRRSANHSGRRRKAAAKATSAAAPTTRAPPSCAGLWRKSATRGSSQTSPSTIRGATTSATTIAAWRQRRWSRTSVAAAAPQATRIPVSSSAEAVIRNPIPGHPAATQAVEERDPPGPDHLPVLAREPDQQPVAAGRGESAGVGAPVPGVGDGFVLAEPDVAVERADEVLLRVDDPDQRVRVRLADEEGDRDGPRRVASGPKRRRAVRGRLGDLEHQIRRSRTDHEHRRHQRDDDEGEEEGRAECDRTTRGRAPVRQRPYALSSPAITTTSAPSASRRVSRSRGSTFFTPRSPATFCAAGFWPSA